ncbi:MULTISPECIES: polysaccharide biosynthesis/export family protein [Rhizobium]|uniref:polysaccharide biosynthesis/export family protein n=1 Tax=Rhizobium TaxID=379 RepID=UPI001959AFCC|nr:MULTISPECIES: polysaccharide biosynthesis/export family protein [Rhizobium]MBM7046785.1 polysaccharide biosynthesis/export family protein [Rhizobium lusitanum]
MIEFRPLKRLVRVNTSFRRVAFAAVCLCAVSAAAHADSIPGYHLGVMDKLHVRVAEWQTAEGTIRDWSVVTGDYTVGPSGSISIPFIGDMPAIGKTTDQIAEAIGIGLQKQFGLRDRPSASVEMSQFRPIYLSGEIQNPGEFPFAPNLTVLKAVSLGGGMRRADAGQRFARDFINAKGDAVVYMAERGRLLMRKARLLAELTNKDEIEVPPELKQLPQATALLASEKALMQTRSQRMTTQLKSLEDLKTLLQNEVETLAKKTDTQSRQLDLAKADRDKVESLADRGLELASRRISAEQRASDLEATLLDTETTSLKAKQDINKANQDEITLHNDWQGSLAQDMQDTDTQLETLQLKLSTSQSLMQEAVAQSADASNLDGNGQDVNVVYTIIRDDNGQTKEITAQENTQVLPGDLIKVSTGLAMR